MDLTCMKRYYQSWIEIDPAQPGGPLTKQQDSGKIHNNLRFLANRLDDTEASEWDTITPSNPKPRATPKKKQNGTEPILVYSSPLRTCP